MVAAGPARLGGRDWFVSETELCSFTSLVVVDEGMLQAAVWAVGWASSGGSRLPVVLAGWPWGLSVVVDLFVASWCRDEAESLILAQNERWRRA